jgi:hypothetical protein
MWTIHKQEDCDIDKKQQANNQGNNIQSNRQHNMENQVTYAELLVQLALRTTNE